MTYTASVSSKVAQHVIDTISGPVCAVDPDYRYIAFNTVFSEAMLDRYGTHVCLGGDALQGITDESDQARAGEDFNRVLAGEAFFGPAWWEDSSFTQGAGLRFTPMRGKDVVSGVLVTAINAADSAEVAAIKEALSSIIDSADDAVITETLEGIVIGVNASAERMFGYAAKEAIGRPAPEIMFPGCVDDVAALLARVAGGESDEHLETVCVHKGGGLIEVLLTASPIYSEAGEVVAASIVARDITARRSVMRDLEAVHEDAVRQEDELRSANAILQNEVSRRALSEERLEKALRALRTLSASNRNLIHADNEQALLQSVCDIAAEDGGYRMAWVGYVEHDLERTVRPVAFSGVEKGYLDSTRITWGDGPNGQGPTGRSIREKRSVLASDLSTEPGFGPWKASAAARGFRSSISLPLFDRQGSVFGALGIYSQDVDSFDSEETLLLEELSSDLAFGIEAIRTRAQRTEAERKVAESHAALKHLLRGMVEMMGKIVETRDPYTEGHERRVAVVARSIAEDMRLPEKDVQAIEIAALIHDIGKLRVPAEILMKPGLLTPLERGFIEEHARAGFEILKGVAFPKDVAQFVLQHHERMDGSGYPDHLSGESILLGARVIAVADVAEAMSSHRPYRPALGVEEAMVEIATHPELYDKKVVESCLSLYEAGHLGL
ncbi:MAG: PAS domain-containing protein [Coriobacteriia bacterium]|nr:PAS domain-containing protein [Coriobacteriia bacterium]